MAGLRWRNSGRPHRLSGSCGGYFPNCTWGPVALRLGRDKCLKMADVDGVAEWIASLLQSHPNLADVASQIVDLGWDNVSIDLVNLEIVCERDGILVRIGDPAIEIDPKDDVVEHG